MITAQLIYRGDKAPGPHYNLTPNAGRDFSVELSTPAAPHAQLLVQS